MSETDWLVGAVTLESAATLTINGNDHDVAAGTYYAYDDDDDLSFVKQVENAIAAEVAGTTVWIGQDRKVHMDFNATATTIAIPAELRELLGFTEAGYGPVATLDAELSSTLIWSPSWIGTTTGSPVGVVGRKVFDRKMNASPSGLSKRVVVHHSTTVLDIAWFAVPSSRAWTAAEAPGEFVRFFEAVLVPGRNLKLYQVLEDDESTTAVSWSAALGPYDCPDPPYDWYERFVQNTDALGANIELTLILTGEYS